MSHPINDLYFEDKAYREYVRNRKNKILSMTNTSAKQEAWNKLFPPMQRSDEWMLSAVNF